MEPDLPLNGRARRNQRREYPRNPKFKQSWPYFAAAMRDLIGTDLPSAIAADIGVATQTVRDWRNGRGGIPPRILETTRQRLRQTQIKLSQSEAGIGLCAPGLGKGSHKRKTPAR